MTTRTARRPGHWLPPLAACLVAASGMTFAHEDPKLHAAIDSDIAALDGATRDGTWQRCVDLAAEADELAAGHAGFEEERLARREALTELASAADAAGVAHRTAVAEHGAISEAARDARDAYEQAIDAHRAGGEAYDAFVRPRDEAVERHRKRRTKLAPVCGALEAAEERWADAHQHLRDFCAEYGQQLRRVAAGQMLARLDDPGAKADAQAGIDRELALHNCLHPVKARDYPREAPAAAN